MDECPHCGEPIEDDAERCRHCGSEPETGWNPDRDYYSLELPEDELEPEAVATEDVASAVWTSVAHWVLVALAALAFLGFGALAYPGSVMPFVFFVLLSLSLLAYHRQPLPRSKRQG